MKTQEKAELPANNARQSREKDRRESGMVRCNMGRSVQRQPRSEGSMGLLQLGS
jgi:hypothetical protein